MQALGTVPSTQRVALPRRFGRAYAARVASQNLVWPLVIAGALPSALAASSLRQWWWSAWVCLLVAALYPLFAIPARYLLFGAVRVLWGVGVIAVLAAGPLRGTQLSGGLTVLDVTVPILLTLGLVTLRVADGRRAVREQSAVLRWPLGHGRWMLVEGQGWFLNHHWRALAQRGALDVVGMVGRGRSTRTVCPGSCEDFAIYGHPVVAPCDGVVRASGDGYPDRAQRGVPAYGNHVVIAFGDGEEVMLAHLRQDSVTVSPGQRVASGDVIGEVGNSGNSSEPHLHIHAVRDGRPLRLRFADVTGSLRRGTVISAKDG